MIGELGVSRVLLIHHSRLLIELIILIPKTLPVLLHLKALPVFRIAQVGLESILKGLLRCRWGPLASRTIRRRLTGRRIGRRSLGISPHTQYRETDQCSRYLDLMANNHEIIL